MSDHAKDAETTCKSGIIKLTVKNVARLSRDLKRQRQLDDATGAPSSAPNHRPRRRRGDRRGE